MQIIMGTISGRMNAQGQDKYGRWAWIRLQGQNNKTLMIYTAYRVCVGQSHKNPQARTVAAQENS
jgi:hypothetical protein